MSSRKPPGRCLYVTCPRCLLLQRLNWKKVRSLPRTIRVGCHPTSNVPVSVNFVCHACRYTVDLGFDTRPYHGMEAAR